jgi:chemotaxis protein CheX
MARHLLYRQVLGVVNWPKLRSLQRFQRLKFGYLYADVFAVMIDDLDHLVSSAVSSVFGTMLNLPVVEESEGAPMSSGEQHLAGSIGFIGIVTGVIFVYSTVSFAHEVTRGMLGLETNITGEEMVNDAFGEITNMIVGHIKSRLADRGMTCVLTIPSILRGSNFTIEPTSSTRRRISTFRCGVNPLVVEVLLKSNSSVSALAA